MKGSRLPQHPSQGVDPASEVAFHFNQKPISGQTGDTIASALYASGTRIFSRSFKYHRPRGIMCMTGDCANCLMNVDGVPNVRTCTTPLQSGMKVNTQNAWPSEKYDALSVLDKLDRFLPVGFYYKSLIRPRFLWHLAQPIIRRVAGLGKVGPDLPLDRRHQHHNQHCDIAVVGGGPAGMTAAIEAARSGLRVTLIDEGPTPGGHLRTDVWEHPELEEHVGLAGYQIAASMVEETGRAANLKVLSGATVFAIYPGTLLGITQGKRLIKLRSKRIIIATGAREVPLVFPGNDLPGVFLSGALQRLIHLYGVLPGKRALVVTANDHGYQVAKELQEAGVQVVAVADNRASIPATATLKDIPILQSQRTKATHGTNHVKSAVTVDLNTGKERRFHCDLVCVSGGYDPNTSLLYQAGSELIHDGALQETVPGILSSTIHVAGDVTGLHDLQLSILQGKMAGKNTVASLGNSRDEAATKVEGDTLKKQMEAAELRYRGSLSLANPEAIHVDAKRKSFVCFCEDVTEKDLFQAMDEGFDEMQTLKRYSTTSMGPCQGKMCLKSAISICSQYTGRSIQETGTTTSRPPLRPLTLGILAGPSHVPIKRTPLHEKHVELGAKMADVGPWKRAHSYGSVTEECRAVRERVGIIDVSTLGKIDVQGADSPALLDKVYTHIFSNLPVGRIRYGLLCSDSGMIMDDGTITRLAKDRYFITTTTGNIDLMEEWLKWWSAGTGWCAHVNNVTSGYAAVNVAGPRARDTLKALTNIDLSPEGFRYMRSATGQVAGVPCILLRIGFVGETGWEIHFPAEYSEHMWDSLMEAGSGYGIAPFGVEAQRVLRLEKKHIIVGQDTDMVSNPMEAGLSWVVRSEKADFIGKHALEAIQGRGLRDRLAGFVMEAPAVPEDGSPVMHNGKPVGRVTSSRPDILQSRGFGFVWVPLELSEAGSLIHIQVGGKTLPARIVDGPFYDPEGKRLRE